jgi:sirohydrochlorin cobaltochelatase
MVDMKTIIVLVMHGAPPNDFPRHELGEFMALYSRMKRETGHSTPPNVQYQELEEKLKNWPRTKQNDPFFAASEELASELSRVSGDPVITGYNEFCAPDVTTALERAAEGGAEKIVVVTPMMTRGGEHAEKEIPELVADFQRAHPQIKTIYAWPYDTQHVALLLKEQINRYNPDFAAV